MKWIRAVVFMVLIGGLGIVWGGLQCSRHGTETHANQTKTVIPDTFAIPFPTESEPVSLQSRTLDMISLRLLTGRHRKFAIRPGNATRG